MPKKKIYNNASPFGQETTPVGEEPIPAGQPSGNEPVDDSEFHLLQDTPMPAGQPSGNEPVDDSEFHLLQDTPMPAGQPSGDEPVDDSEFHMPEQTPGNTVPEQQPPQEQPKIYNNANENGLETTPVGEEQPQEEQLQEQQPQEQPKIYNNASPFGQETTPVGEEPSFQFNKEELADPFRGMNFDEQPQEQPKIYNNANENGLETTPVDENHQPIDSPAPLRDTPTPDGPADGMIDKPTENKPEVVSAQKPQPPQNDGDDDPQRDEPVLAQPVAKTPLEPSEVAGPETPINEQVDKPAKNEPAVKPTSNEQPTANETPTNETPTNGTPTGTAQGDTTSGKDTPNKDALSQHKPTVVAPPAPKKKGPEITPPPRKAPRPRPQPGTREYMDAVLAEHRRVTSPFLEPDPRTGQMRKLTERDLNAIREQEMLVNRATNEYLNSPAGREPNLYNQNINRIRGMSAGNMRALQNAATDGTMDFNQIMQQARSRNIQMNPNAAQRMMNNPAPHQLMQMNGPGGAQMRGIFTTDPQMMNQAMMGQMARFLNVPNIMPPCAPITMQMPNGQMMQGVFMSFASGSNPGFTTVNDPYFSSNAGMFTNTPALRSVANVGAMDYICGNTDRRPEDMAYRFGQNGQFRGVCGTNMGNAFAPNTGANIADVPVMSTGMAAGIQATTPEMMHYGMQGYGIPPATAAAVVDRFRNMQGAIAPGAQNPIPVVPNNQWNNVNLNDMAANTVNPNNAFLGTQFVANNQQMYFNQHALQQQFGQPVIPPGTVAPNRMPGAPAYRQPGLPLQHAALEGDRMPGFRYMKSGDYFAGLATQTKNLAQTLKNMNRITTGSAEYDNVQKYLNYMTKEFDRMAKEPVGKQLNPVSAVNMQLAKKNEMMDTLRDLTDAYLDRRGLQTKEKPNMRAKLRQGVIRTANMFASANGAHMSDSMEQLYDRGAAKERVNAFKNMDPKQVGNLIKQTAKNADLLAKKAKVQYSSCINESQELLTDYLRQVKDLNPAQIGLNQKDLKNIKQLGTVPTANQPRPQHTYGRIDLDKPQNNRGRIDLDKPGHDMPQRKTPSAPTV